MEFDDLNNLPDFDAAMRAVIDGIKAIVVPAVWRLNGAHLVRVARCPNCRSVAGISGDEDRRKHCCHQCHTWLEYDAPAKDEKR